MEVAEALHPDRGPAEGLKLARGQHAGAGPGLLGDRREAHGRLFRLGLLAGFLWCPFTAAQEAPREDPILDTGIVERTGVSLMLLDVEVRDEQGRPLRGLKREDFAVYLNGEPWPLVSADELCPCPDPGLEAVSGAEPPGAAEHVPSPAAPVPVADETRFVLYIDFSQMQPDGRSNALSEAGRWIREVMQPADEVMLAAYTDENGLQRLTPFTRDKTPLIAALDGLAADAATVDPFARLFGDRVGACRRCVVPCAASCGYTGHCCLECLRECPHCVRDGHDERNHGRRALSALRRLLQGLETVPGRKNLLYFHQNQVLMLNDLYPCTDVRVGNHSLLLDRVAADATLARTKLYTVVSGDFRLGETANVGANLADFTGGGFNRGPTDMARLIDRAGRGCACTYRLGLRAKEEGSVFRVRVEALGRALPNRYRVQHLTAADRWWRRAESTLADPDLARDVPVAAAIVPRAGHGRSWDLNLQVALDASMLEMLPEGARTKGSWEVGALLVHEKSGRSWEMLGISDVRAPGDGDLDRAFIVHERLLEGLAPGDYELRAFVRDRWANLFGGARATIGLPRIVPGTLAGPLMLGAETAHIRTALPPRKKKSAPDPPAGGAIQEGPLPLAGRSVVRGEPVEFATWACPGADRESVYDVQRFVSREERLLFRFDEMLILDAGDCALLRDRLDTTPMDPGPYTYHARWNPERGADPVSARISFEVTDPTAPRPAEDDPTPPGPSVPDP